MLLLSLPPGGGLVGSGVFGAAVPVGGGPIGKWSLSRERNLGTATWFVARPHAVQA